jgi:hypothetical protein
MIQPHSRKLSLDLVKWITQKQFWNVIGSEIFYSIKGSAIPCPKFLSSNFGKLDSDITNIVTKFDAASICNGFHLTAEGHVKKLKNTCIKEMRISDNVSA